MVVTRSKCLKRHFLENVVLVPLCANISQQRKQLAKCSKVRCKDEEERFQIMCNSNRYWPQNGPFSQIVSHMYTDI